MSGIFVKSAAPVSPLTSSKTLSSILRLGENTMAPAATTSTDLLKGAGMFGRGALNLAGNVAKTTARGAWNYAIKPTGRALWSGTKATARLAGDAAGYYLTHPKGQRSALNGLKGLLGLTMKGYKLPFTAGRAVARGFGASPRLAGAIGGGALLSAYLGREAARTGGKLDLSSPGTYGNMLFNPIRDSYNIAAGGLGKLFSDSDKDVAGLAGRSEVGAADADAQRVVHAAQNAGMTARPDL